MSKAEELLQNIASTPVVTAGAGDAEEHIVIGKDRVIVVPEALKNIGVQFDHNIETVTIDCPRYWDENDMSTMKIYVNYMRPDGHVGMHLCDNLVVEDEIMSFDWTISGDVTNVEGNIQFLVCIKKTDTEGNEENHWNSRLCEELYISKGLKCQETVLRRFPDIITQLLTRMDEVEVEQQNWEKITYEELDKRMKQAEANTSPEEILNRIHDALVNDSVSQDIITEITEEYIETNPVIAETIDKADQAISIAKGANQSVAYTSYEEMVSVFNSLSVDKFKEGQNVYIGAVGVPDLFIYGKEETAVEYTYVDDQAIIDAMMDNVWFQVGYYKLAQLETQNVDIRDVITPLMADGWQADDDGTYFQTVLIEGLGAGNNPVVTLYSVADRFSDEELEAYSCISDVDVAQGAITFIASEKPVTSITVVVKSVTAAEGTEYAVSSMVKSLDLVKETVGYTNKNLISYPYYDPTRTVNGLAITDNGDGTITVNGTATAKTYHVIKHWNPETGDDLILDEGTYILTGCPAGGGAATYALGSADHTNANFVMDFGTGGTVTMTERNVRGLYIVICKGVTVENLTFKPMIRKAEIADDTWEPYKKSVDERINAVEVALTDVVVPLLLSDWVAEDDHYIQNIAVNGLGTVSAPIVVLSSVNEIASEDELYSYACISDVVVTEGILKFIASEKPSISFTVIAKGVVASDNDVAADITALVGRVSELEEASSKLNSDTTMLDSNLELLRGFKDMFGSSTEINDCNNAPNGSIMIAYASAKNSPHMYDPCIIFTFGDKNELYKWQLGLKADSISVRRRYEGTWTSWKDIM